MILTALVCAFYVRDDLSKWLSSELYYSVAITLVVSIFIWSRIGLYKAVIRFIDTKALSVIFVGAIISGTVLVLSSYFLKTVMPRSIPFIYTTLVLLLVGGSRLMIRGLINTQNSHAKIPVVIYGAGSAGRQLAFSLHHGAEFHPVAFIDDKPELQKMTVAGLKIFKNSKLTDLITKYDVQKLLLAIPSASSEQRKNLITQLELLPIEVLTIPGSADLVSGKLKVDTLLKVDVADLLGRESVTPIDRLFRRCIENKNVMVTGGGGSIGSELCRQIIKQSPANLVIFESSEFALYSIEKELNELANSLNSRVKIIPILASVLDKPLVENVIKNYKINTVYHAAAYKHVPLVEYNVVSGIRNNVWGTLICAEAAIKCSVENFVLISTDKAVRPTNVMGSSKRLAELILQALAYNESLKSIEDNKDNITTNFSMVRFGNVLGSSGSVVPLFQKQIAENGPVTITHPDITRYFMTIPEAAQLVIQAGAMGLGGEVYVLDMGKPVKINELAKKMVHLSGLTIKDEKNLEGDIEITYTGLRPGEKLYEELLIGSSVEGTEHQRIMKAKEISMSWDDLQNLLDKLKIAMDNSDIALVRQILLAAPLGFNPSSEIADHLWLKSKESAADLDNEPLQLVIAPNDSLKDDLVANLAKS